MAMKKSRHIAFCIAVLLCAAAAVLPAQSLLDNEYYKKAQDLRYQSEQALQEGDYDAAASLAAEAKENLAKSDAFVEEAMSFYRANGWLKRANERIAYAKSIDADVHFKVAYDKAVTDASGAKEALDAKDYEKSLGLSRSAFAALEGIRVVEATPQVVEPEAAEPSWPQYYEVRLLRARRDCFWRIAEYPFVYNDPWKWKILYEANKSLLTDPKNPDLIEPGQVFEIPSLAGEKREGAWDPEKSYPPLP
jgi:nucleoid-associated protein YgaU